MSQRVPLVPLEDPPFGQRSASLVSSPRSRDHVAGRAVVHDTWLDLVQSTHLASALDHSSLDQIIGTCVLLSRQLPDADKPSLVDPSAIDWATATDRHRLEVRSSSQVRKDHDEGAPIHSNGTPGLDVLTRPSAQRRGRALKNEMSTAMRSQFPPWQRCCWADVTQRGVYTQTNHAITLGGPCTRCQQDRTCNG